MVDGLSIQTQNRTVKLLATVLSGAGKDLQRGNGEGKLTNVQYNSELAQ
jgi:hypothetical protein